MSTREALICTALVLSTLTSAQAASKAAPAVTEPEYVGICYALKGGDTTLHPLERQTFAIRAKAKAMGFGGSRASYEVPGPASPVRFTAGEPLTFIVRLAAQEADPSTVLKLVPLESGAPPKKQAKAGAGGARQAVMMDQRGMFGNVNVDPMLGALPILAKPYGESSLQFRPEGELAPGEYAVLMQASMTAFCFGIDAKPAK